MQTYEALLKLRNEKGTTLGKPPKNKTKEPKKKKDKEKSKDIFDDLINSTKVKEPRYSVSNLEMSKHLSTDPKKPSSFFNMSGGNEDSESSSDDAAIKELEEENKRLKALIEYKDFELNKYK